MVPACNENDISPAVRQLSTEVAPCATCSENHNTHHPSRGRRSQCVTARVFGQAPSQNGGCRTIKVCCVQNWFAARVIASGFPSFTLRSAPWHFPSVR